MPDNPRKKKLDRKRQSQQKHEVAYRNRARGARSSKRTSSRNRASSQSRARRSNRGQSTRSRTTRGQRGAAATRSQRRGSQTLRELLTEEMADIYNAEKQLVRALPKMARAATSEQLRSAFEQHLDETQEQVRRIEQAFEALGERPKSKKCDAMEGLIEEGDKMLEEDFEGAVMDAGLIAAAQKIEHYEIASYGTICTWAEVLGENAALRFLKQTMSEEEATDRRLTDLSRQINEEAKVGGGEQQGEEQGGIRGFVSRVFPS